MATLSTPTLEKINAFDPNFNFDVKFYYSDAQAIKNRAVITDTDDYSVVYDKTISTLKLVHTIPANVLTAGKQYTIKIQVFDIDGNNSSFSSETLFYCYSTPVFSLAEVNNPYRVASITAQLNYSQAEGETLKSFQYILCDYNKNPIDQSNVLYSDSDTHTFYGLENNMLYYLHCIGESTHGFSLVSNYVEVNVSYNILPANILFEIENHRCLGYISLITNLTVVGYDTENDNYSFDNGTVALWNNSLHYNDGFEVDGDFVFYIEAKGLPLGMFCKTASDEFTLSIVKVCDTYYCELKHDNYVIYVNLPKAQLTTSDGSILVNELGQKIEIINVDYDDDNFVVFEVKRINGLYGLKAYYKSDYLTNWKGE